MIASITSEAQMSAAEAISMIKNDGLVVRINCYDPKLDTLEQLIKHGDIKDETREKLIVQRQEAIDKYQMETKSILSAFRQHYKFSNVYFVPDSLFKEFVDGRREHIFLDDELQLVTKDAIADKFVFVFIDDRASLHKFNIRHSKFIPQLAEYKRVLPPMKHEVGKANGFVSVLKFGLAFTLKDWIDDGVQKLVRHFENLHDKL